MLAACGVLVGIISYRFGWLAGMVCLYGGYVLYRLLRWESYPSPSRERVLRTAHANLFIPTQISLIPLLFIWRGFSLGPDTSPSIYIAGGVILTILFWIPVAMFSLVSPPFGTSIRVLHMMRKRKRPQWFVILSDVWGRDWAFYWIDSDLIDEREMMLFGIPAEMKVTYCVWDEVEGHKERLKLPSSFFFGRGSRFSVRPLWAMDLNGWLSRLLDRHHVRLLDLRSFYEDGKIIREENHPDRVERFFAETLMQAPESSLDDFIAERESPSTA